MGDAFLMVGDGGVEVAMVEDDGDDPESGLAGMASLVFVSIGAGIAESESRID